MTLKDRNENWAFCEFLSTCLFYNSLQFHEQTQHNLMTSQNEATLVSLSFHDNDPSNLPPSSSSLMWLAEF